MPTTDQSPAVIDATDAQLVPAGRTLTASDVNRELGQIEADLPQVAGRIQLHSAGLVYAIVEFGFLLMRARQLHVCTTVVHTAEGKISGRPAGFQGWLKQWQIKRQTAYDYITSAENAGLTADSDPVEVRMLRDRDALADQTPEKLRKRKPKVLLGTGHAESDPLTPEEEAVQEVEDRNARWDRMFQELFEFGIDKDEWAKLDDDRRAKHHSLFTELATRIKPSLRKQKALPAVVAHDTKQT